MKLGARLAWLAAALSLAATVPSPALPQWRAAVRVRPGFDGEAKAGRWYPARVRLEARGQPWRGNVELRGSNTLCRRFVELPLGSAKEVLLYACGGDPRVALEGLDEDEVEVVVAPPVGPTESESCLVLLVSDAASVGSLGFLRALRLPGGTGSPRVAVAAADRAGLPDNLLGFDGVDVVVLGQEDYEALGAGQNESLHQWVLRGGTLVVPGGVNPERFRSWPLEVLFPVELTGTARLERLRPLAFGAVGAVGTVGEAGSSDEPFLVARGRPRSGATVLEEQEGLPLLATVERGAGRVVFLALDLEKSPLGGGRWGERERLWRSILPWRGLQLRSAESSVAQAWERQEAVPGTAAEAAAVRSALRLASVRPPSAFLVLGFVCVYVLAVGPLQYVALRRLGRLELAWVVTPVLAVAFFLCAFLVGYARLGGQTILRELTFLRGAVGDGTLLQDGFVRLFSERTQDYSVRPRGAGGAVVRADGAGDEAALTCVGSMVAAGPTRYFTWEHHDAVAFGSVRNDLGLAARLRWNGTALRGTLRNGGARAVRNGFLLSRRRALPLPGGRGLAPGAEATVAGELLTYTVPTARRFGGKEAEGLDALWGTADAGHLAALLEKLDPSRCYLVGFIEGAPSAVAVEPPADREDLATLAVLEVPVELEPGGAYVHPMERVVAQSRPLKSSSKVAVSWSPFSLRRIRVEDDQPLELTITFQDYDPVRHELADLDLILMGRQSALNVTLVGPEGARKSFACEGWHPTTAYDQLEVGDARPWLSAEGTLTLELEVASGHNRVELESLSPELRLRLRRGAP